MKLYHHKTDGGAEYLTDKFIVCPNREKEGVFEGATYIVRIDGDITKDAELSIREDKQLKDKLHRRNMQIKDLKAENEHLNTLINKFETKYDITVLNR